MSLIQISGGSSATPGAETGFTTIQPPSGTSPVSDSTTDTLEVTSTDGSMVITGDSTTDTIDFSSKVYADYGTHTKDVAEFYHDFLFAPAPLGVSKTGTGAAARNDGASSTADHPGVLLLRTGTTTTGNAWLYGTDQDNTLKLGAAEMHFEAIVKLSALSDGTDTYVARAGLHYDAIAGGTPTNGLFFQYTHSASAGNWELRGVTSSTPTTSDTGVAASTNWVVLTWVLNAAGTSAQAYINRVAVGDPVTVIPTSTMSIGVSITKSAGTTSRDILVDSVKFLVKLATART